MSIQDDFPNETFASGQPSEPTGVSNPPGSTYNLSGSFPGASIYIHSQVLADTQWKVNRPYLLKRCPKRSAGKCIVKAGFSANNRFRHTATAQAY